MSFLAGVAARSLVTFPQAVVFGVAVGRSLLLHFNQDTRRYNVVGVVDQNGGQDAYAPRFSERRNASRARNGSPQSSNYQHATYQHGAPEEQPIALLMSPQEVLDFYMDVGGWHNFDLSCENRYGLVPVRRQPSLPALLTLRTQSSTLTRLSQIQNTPSVRQRSGLVQLLTTASPNESVLTDVVSTPGTQQTFDHDKQPSQDRCLTQPPAQPPPSRTRTVQPSTTNTTLDPTAAPMDSMHSPIDTSHQQPSRFMADFSPSSIQPIGSGGFGSVFRGLHRLDGVEYAVKRLVLTVASTCGCQTQCQCTVNALLSHQALKEVRILAKVSNHPNVVRYHHSWLEPLTPDLRALLQVTPDEEETSMSDVVAPGAAGSVRRALGLPPLSPAVLANSLPLSQGVSPCSHSPRGSASVQVDYEPTEDDSRISNCPSLDASESSSSSLSASSSSLSSSSSNSAASTNSNSSTNSILRELAWPMSPVSTDPIATPNARHSRHSLSSLSTPSSDSWDHPATSASSLPSSLPASMDSPSSAQNALLCIQMELCAAATLDQWLASASTSISSSSSSSSAPSLGVAVPSGNIEIRKQQVLALFVQVIKGLHHVHQTGFIHRDIKPANIFIQTGGQVKIGDFGLSATRTSHSLTPASDDWRGSHTGGVGTMTYASPEQLNGETRYDHHVDMFPLGLILYESLAAPFQTQSERLSKFNLIRQGTLPPTFAAAYPKIGELVLSLCSLHPAARPCTASLLRHELFCSAPLPIPATSVSATASATSAPLPSSTHSGKHVKLHVQAPCSRASNTQAGVQRALSQVLGSGGPLFPPTHSLSCAGPFSALPSTHPWRAQPSTQSSASKMMQKLRQRVADQDSQILALQRQLARFQGSAFA